MIIKGNSVGCVRSNWNQTDPKEADYIIGKELVENAIQEAKTDANNAQTAADNAQTAADNAQTTANNAQTAAGNAQTAADNAQNMANSAQTKADSKPDIKVVSVTLASGSWSSKEQQVTVNGVLSDTAKCHIIPTPAPASHAAYYDCDVRATAQAANKVTFACEEVPTSNLTVNVAIILQGVTS